jgi:transcriptional regulator with XRE-family HTH domain
MDELISEITRKIEGVMREKGINRTQLAKMMGVSKSHISRLLSGNRNMRLSTVETLADILGITLKIEIWDTIRLQDDADLEGV